MGFFEISAFRGSVAATLFWSTLAMAQPNSQEDLIIFLHNAWHENNKAGEPHGKFGPYAFEEIKAALAQGGEVMAPERGANADPTAEAANLVEELEALIAAGREPSHIKVVGASKGAFIAQLASGQIANPQIRWVLVGGCHFPRMAEGNPPQMTGNVLSIYDTSDTIAGPCRPHPDLFQRASRFEEVAISTGLDHGFQFTVQEAWVAPALDW